MENFLYFIVFWLFAGFVGFLISRFRPQTQYETPWNPIRAILGGFFTLICEWMLIYGSDGDNY